MDNFFKSPDYIKMKTDYEKENFKLFGSYCWYDNDKLHEKTPSAMAEYFKNKKISVEVVEQHTSKKGAVISSSRDMEKSFYQIWSEDPQMREYKEVIFNCDLEQVKDYQFNLFNGFNHFNNFKQVETVSLSPIFEHIRTLSNYNEGHYNYILDYLAQLVQKPHILPHTCLIFITEEGVGKDIFSNFLGDVISEKYTGNVEKLELVCGKFNTALGGKLLFTLNETDPVESRERLENIKYLITADKIMIEGKHKDAVKCKNFCRFIFFSNRLFAFPVEKGARRPVIFKSSNKYLAEQIGADENKKYFNDLVSKFKDKKYQHAFLRFLQNRDISNFNPQKFEKSELHETLEQNSISPIVGFLSEIVKNHDGEKETVRFTTLDTYNDCCLYMRTNNYKYDISQQKFNVEMEITYKIKKIRSNGMKFEFNIPTLKAMLEKDYKYSFTVDDESNELEAPKEKRNMKPNDNEKFYENNLNRIINIEDDFKNKYEELLIKYNDLLKVQDVKEEVKEEVKEHVKEEVKEIEIKPTQINKVIVESEDDSDDENSFYNDVIRPANYSQNKPLDIKSNDDKNICVSTENREIKPTRINNVIVESEDDSDDETYADEIRPLEIKKVIVESEDDSDDDIKPMPKTPPKEPTKKGIKAKSPKKEVKPKSPKKEIKAKSPKKEIKPKSPKKETPIKEETDDDNLNINDDERDLFLSLFKKN